MKRIEWRNDYLIITAIVLVAILVVFVPTWMPVQAAQPAPPEPAVCAEWGVAGGWTLTKCEDENGIVCISSTSGMLSCKWDQ